MIKLKLFSIVTVIIFITSCSRNNSGLNNNSAKKIDTTINDVGRLFPKKLRQIPFGIVAGHFPNPCYAEFENGKYIWKHNTTVTANKDLKIVEYGSFVYSKYGWYLRVTYTAKDFDEHYGTKNGQLKNGVTYSDPASWRMSDSLFAGDAMWYYIAKDINGNLFKGIAPIETEGIKLSNVEIKKGYSKFSTIASKINWTGYGEIGSYSLSGDMKLKSGIYKLENDTLKNAEIIFDVASITSKQEGLVNHLTGEDFFDCAKYPTAEFVLLEAINLKDKSIMARGILTIKGISEEISFPINYALADKKISIEGRISFDRTKFNIKYNSKSFFSNLGDQAIKNTIDINFSISNL